MYSRTSKTGSCKLMNQEASLLGTKALSIYGLMPSTATLRKVAEPSSIPQHAEVSAANIIHC